MTHVDDSRPTSVVFYFQVHQPYRLRHFSFFDIGKHTDLNPGELYFDDDENERIVQRVAKKCYLPMTALLQRLCEEHDGRFRCAFSISGTALSQFERWSPETLKAFQDLAETGCVEFLAETSHHSLASLESEDEFRAQVRSHTARIEELFGTRPTSFRNTELVTSNHIACMAEEEGFATIMAEGADHLLGWRSPHLLYRPEETVRISTQLRSYSFSDDIAFRFSNREWAEWPLSAPRFASWLEELPAEDEIVGLYMDFETFGEHQWADTGIFEFMEKLPEQILASGRFEFHTPAQVAAERDCMARLDIPEPVSWADAERDLTAWLDNPMQRAAHKAVYELREAATAAADAGEAHILETWRRLSTSDHFYYMCTKFFSDGDVHKYFSPYATPHDAYIALMNVLGDFRRRLGLEALPPAPH
ncbi:MAG: alpha-amylase [Planctomycetota bacterium]|jgi:alpha-amylase